MGDADAPLKYHEHRDNGPFTKGREGVYTWHVKKFCPSAKDLLDLGCGTGDLVAHGLNEGLNMVGLDIRKNIYRIDKSRFVRADARKLPFMDSSFDGVIDSMMTVDMIELQKLPSENVRFVVMEVGRVLRPGGVLVSTDAVYVNEFYEEAGLATLYYNTSWGVYRKP